MPPRAESGASTRHLPRWLLIAAMALLVARIGTGIYEARNAPDAPDAPDLVRWRPLAQAVEESRRTRRPILYDFTAEWCAPCHVMQREVFADRQAAEQIEALFVPVRVLDRRREEGRNAAWVDSLERHYRVEGFPTLVVAPLQGEPTVLVGYNGRERTMQGLTAAAMKGMMPGGMPQRP